ncbi:MAG TPA: energy-coupling factor transporter transmembrane component T [Pirellulales bacterium]|jgi:energy-coupling factor transport system permease protein
MNGLGWLEMNDRSWLARRDPRLKLAWLAVLSLASVLIESREGLYLLFAVALLVAICLRLTARTWIVIGAILTTTAWGTVFSQALFFIGDRSTPHITLIAPRTVGTFEFSGLQLWRDGAMFGLLQSLRLLAVTLAGLSVCLSTGPQRLLAALVAVRVPMAVSFMAIAALRFLPTIVGEWATVRRSCRLRGYRPQPWRAPWKTASMEMALLAPVVAASLRRAATLATSLASRGFDATRPRTTYPALRMTSADLTLFLVLVAMAVALSTLKSFHWLAVARYVCLSGFEPFYDWISRWL